MPRSSALPTSRSATAVQAATRVLGIAFLLVGVLGFIPGVTTNYSDLTMAGQASNALLFGVFQVSVLHNVTHLAFGLTAVACARAEMAARGYLIVAAVLYYVLSVYGLLLDQHSTANFLPLNTADNWLHIVLTIYMLGAGILLARSRRQRTPEDPAPRQTNSDPEQRLRKEAS